MFLFVKWRGLFLATFNSLKKNKKMEKLKLIVGFILLPVAFSIWVIDRIFYSIMPQHSHENFNKWLTTPNVIFASVRVLLIFIFRWLLFWIFGV